MVHSLRHRAAFVVMALVALVLGHSAAFLASYGRGYADALSRTGHDADWTFAVIAVLALGSGLLLSAVRRLQQLGLLTRDLESQPRGGRLGWRRLVGHLLPLWLRLSLVAVLLFVVQENLEHLGTGEPLPWLGVLGSPEYPNGLAIVAAVAFGVALVGALFRWRRDVLIARLAAACHAWRRDTTDHRRTPLDSTGGRPGSILGRRLAVRAPPRKSVAPALPIAPNEVRRHDPLPRASGRSNGRRCRARAPVRGLRRRPHGRARRTVRG